MSASYPLPPSTATSALLWAPACSSSSDDPAPKNQVTTGSIAGTFSPLLGMFRVTATPVGGGSSFTATLDLGTYAFAALPPGDYTLSPGARSPSGAGCGSRRPR
jgi:hypothetical protein